MTVLQISLLQQFLKIVKLNFSTHKYTDWSKTSRIRVYAITIFLHHFLIQKVLLNQNCKWNILRVYQISQLDCFSISLCTCIFHCIFIHIICNIQNNGLKAFLSDKKQKLVFKSNSDKSICHDLFSQKSKSKSGYAKNIPAFFLFHANNAKISFTFVNLNVTTEC